MRCLPTTGLLPRKGLAWVLVRASLATPREGGGGSPEDGKLGLAGKRQLADFPPPPDESPISGGRPSYGQAQGQVVTPGGGGAMGWQGWRKFPPLEGLGFVMGFVKVLPSPSAFVSSPGGSMKMAIVKRNCLGWPEPRHLPAPPVDRAPFSPQI